MEDGKNRESAEREPAKMSFEPMRQKPELVQALGDDVTLNIAVVPTKERKENTEQKKSVVEILMRDGSEIEHKQKEYVFKPYFPVGYPAIITADPGTGKSKYICGLVAKVTIGENLCGIPCQHPGNVVYFSKEDGADDIVTTVRACGGDTDKLKVFSEEDDALDYMAKHPIYFSSNEIEEVIKAKKPTLVIFDTMQKFIPPNVDTFRNNQTSAVFAYINKLAKKYECAIILVTHNVKMKVGLSLRAQVNGSSDIVGSARSALAVVPFPGVDEQGNNLVIHIKSNNKIGKAIHYKIKSIPGDEDFATIEFVGLKEYYESDYMREAYKKTAKSEPQITDNNYIVRTILKLMEENPKGFKISRTDLQDSIYAYTGQTIDIPLSDLRKEYGDYLNRKHNIGMQDKGNTTLSRFVRKGESVTPAANKALAVQIRKNPVPYVT